MEAEFGEVLQVSPWRSGGSSQTGLVSDFAQLVLVGEKNYSSLDLAFDYWASLALVDLDQETVLEMTKLPFDFASLLETLHVKVPRQEMWEQKKTTHPNHPL